MSDQNTVAIQALLTEMTAMNERLEGLAKHNSRLLDQVMDAKRKGSEPDKTADDPTKVDWAALNKAIQAKISNPDDVDGYRKGDPIRISRTDALDPRAYAAAQAKAKELGVPLEMTDDRPSAQQERPVSYQSRETDTTLIDTVDDTAQKLRFVRHDVATGGAGIIQNGLAAERDGYRMVTFKSDDDLPDAMKTKIGLMASARQAAGSND